jgi:hypothetical protein
MSTLSASPGNAYRDDGMPGMNATTTEVQKRDNERINNDLLNTTHTTKDRVT